VIIGIQLPDAASMDRTFELTEGMNATFRDTPGLENWFVLGGFSLLDGTNTPNAATAFIAWKDWKYRKTPELQQNALVARLQQQFGQERGATIMVIVPPAIMGLGLVGGFQMQIEDREGVGLDALQERTMAIMMAAASIPEVGSDPSGRPRAFSVFRS